MSDAALSRSRPTGRPAMAEPPKDFPPEQMVPGKIPPVPKLALVAMIAMISPIWLDVAGVLLAPTRLLFVTCLPVLLVMLFMGKFGKVVLTDYLMLFYSFWMYLSIALFNTDVVLVFGTLQMSLVLGGYLIGRASIRTLGDWQAMARLFGIIVVCMAPLAVHEAITAAFLIPDFIASLPGFSSVTDVTDKGYPRRFGLDRAQVVFGHPIHFGLYCAMPISLFFIGLRNKISFVTRGTAVALMLAACFTSVSSGPLLSAIFQTGLIGYFMMLDGHPKQWPILLWGLAIIYAIIEIGSDTFGLYAVAVRLAFNSNTASIRRTLWEYGTAQVADHPILGIGHNWWNHPVWMSGSIDNYWLQLAILYGIPASFAMIAVYFSIMIRAGRGKFIPGSDAYNARVAVTFLLVTMFLILATVTIWNEVLGMVMFLLGSSVFLLQPLAGEAPQAAADPRAARSRGGGRPVAADPAPPPRGGAGTGPGSSAPVYTRFPKGSVPAGGVRPARPGSARAAQPVRKRLNED